MVCVLNDFGQEVLDRALPRQAETMAQQIRVGGLLIGLWYPGYPQFIAGKGQLKPVAARSFLSS